ncbi:MAG: ABC transporter substrate-binding protein, partial [Lachnospiraceae bacterium]|nr:ABC transporter substrate-binding protein [Lachnospiraceae bacterium]
MKGKVLSVTMSLLLAGGMLAGCGSSSTDTASTTAAASKEATEASTQAGSSETNSDGKTTITFWHYMSEDKEGKYVKEAVDKFNASQNEIYVEQQYFPRDELMKQYTIGVVSGELPDVGMVDNPDHNSYASMGVFEDITDLYKNSDDQHFLEGSIGS